MLVEEFSSRWSGTQISYMRIIVHAFIKDNSFCLDSVVCYNKIVTVDMLRKEKSMLKVFISNPVVKVSTVETVTARYSGK